MNSAQLANFFIDTYVESADFLDFRDAVNHKTTIRDSRIIKCIWMLLEHYENEVEIEE